MITSKLKLYKVLLVIILILGIVFVGLGQSSFEKGYYISWENDTVHGLINNRGGSGNSLSCTFKKDESSKQVRFTADDIQGYRFANGQYYISKEINIRDRRDRVFVEFLVDGISNLYFYRDLEEDFYIIENQNGELLELYKENINNVEGRGEVKVDSYRHIRMLKLAFSDCMEIQPQLENTYLSHKSLIKLTKDYHNYVCFDQECIVYEKKIGPPKIYFAPIIGVTSSTLGFDREFYSRFDYDQNMNLAFGAQLNVVLARLNKKISLQFDVLYNKNDFYGTYNNYYELYINSSMLQSSLLLKYSFPGRSVRPSLGLGLLGNFLLSTEYKAFVENVPGNPAQEQELEDIYLTDNLFGAVFQVGLNYRILQNREMFTNFRYTLSAGSSRSFDGFVKTSLNSLNFSVGMYLSKVK